MFSNLGAQLVQSLLIKKQLTFYDNDYLLAREYKINIKYPFATVEKGVYTCMVNINVGS